MAPPYGRVRFVGNCILGTIFALPAALILSFLTTRKEGFLVFLFPLAIAFTMMIEKSSDRTRKRDAARMREESKKRYENGEPPIGV